MKNRSSRRTGVLLIRWVVVPVLVLSGGFLVASNAVLQTRPVRGWFERKLERNSGLDWTIRYLSWTPWSGVQVGGVTAELESERAGDARPLYAVDEMDVEVYWDLLLKGQLAPREMRLKSVRAAVPIELMDLLPVRNDPAAEGPPEVAAKEPEEEGNPAPKEGGPTGPKPRSGDGPGRTKPRPERKPAPRTGSEEAGPVPASEEVVRPAPGRAVNLVVEDCELVVYSLTGNGREGLAVRGLEAEIPLGGADREGWVQVAEVSAGGEPVAGAFRVGLQWTSPFLVMPARPVEWAGLEMEVAASIRARGAPLCNAEMRMAPAGLEPTKVPFLPEARIEAGEVRMHSVFQGNLADVKTWRGDAVAEMNAVRLRRDDEREDVTFDYGRVTTALRGRAVQVVDARLLSERLSFLGNGLALPDGRVFGIIRVVVDREYAEALTKVAVGSFLAGGWTPSWFAPLLTPDRQFRDINVRGTIREATVDVGKHREVLPVDRAWERLVGFLRQEAEETQAGIPPSPPRERIWTPPPS